MYKVDRFRFEPNSGATHGESPIAFRLDFLDILHYSRQLFLFEVRPEKDLFTNLRGALPLVVQKYNSQKSNPNI